MEWNERNAAHLYRRAGFGASATELRAAVARGLEATVDLLVDFSAIDNSALESRLSGLRLDRTTTQGIIRWWLTRMIHTARPLEEKLTFFWHDHFATAIFKVKEQGLMFAQNQLLRSSALGNFTELGIAISKDPAMLIWLDNARNRKEHPNENYARELLELFTLGLGHYSELDVQSAAKAFTGWTIERNTKRFVFLRSQHDFSQKDFLGRVGDWDGDDIVRIACGEFAHAQFIAAKLFSFLAYENPEQALVDRLARIYLDNGTAIRPLVSSILKSEEMYSERALWSRVKSPVEATVMATRALAVDSDTTRAATGALSLQGQVPFNPPDVDGWISGLTWINSGTLLSRMNYANSISGVFDPARFTGGLRFTDAATMVNDFLHRMGPLEVSSATRAQLVTYVLSNGAFPSGDALVLKQRGLAHMILSLPEWQMN